MSLSTSLFLYITISKDTATTVDYTLSLHDALPICPCSPSTGRPGSEASSVNKYSEISSSLKPPSAKTVMADRKSTRLNSSHVAISYAVFCLKNKNKNDENGIHHL